MVNLGLRDLGYNYVVLDDCWAEGRNASGYLQAIPSKFPSGMKSVADQIHDLNMKFGMYSSAGVYTCGRYPGSLGHETEDAQYFAEVGADYLKCEHEQACPSVLTSISLTRLRRQLLQPRPKWHSTDQFQSVRCNVTSIECHW